jgi:hypothetical protein
MTELICLAGIDCSQIQRAASFESVDDGGANAGLFADVHLGIVRGAQGGRGDECTAND